MTAHPIRILLPCLLLFAVPTCRKTRSSPQSSRSSASNRATRRPPHVPKMSSNRFWELIGRSLKLSDGNRKNQLSAMRQILRRMQPKEIIDFQVHFDTAMTKSYSWELWAAVYIINGGCSDDCFMDFRALGNGNGVGPVTKRASVLSLWFQRLVHSIPPVTGEFAYTFAWIVI